MSGKAKDEADAESLGMERAVEGAEAAVGELDDAPVEARKDGDIDAGEELVFELGVAGLVGAIVVVADTGERLQVRHGRQDVGMERDARADLTAAQGCCIRDTQNGAADIAAQMYERARKRNRGRARR